MQKPGLFLILIMLSGIANAVALDRSHCTSLDQSTTEFWDSLHEWSRKVSTLNNARSLVGVPSFRFTKEFRLESKRAYYHRDGYRRVPYTDEKVDQLDCRVSLRIESEIDPARNQVVFKEGFTRSFDEFEYWSPFSHSRDSEPTKSLVAIIDRDRNTLHGLIFTEYLYSPYSPKKFQMHISSSLNCNARQITQSLEEMGIKTKFYPLRTNRSCSALAEEHPTTYID